MPKIVNDFEQIYSQVTNFFVWKPFYTINCKTRVAQQ